MPVSPPPPPNRSNKKPSHVVFLWAESKEAMAWWHRSSLGKRAKGDSSLCRMRRGMHEVLFAGCEQQPLWVKHRMQLESATLRWTQIGPPFPGIGIYLSTAFPEDNQQWLPGP